MKLLLKYFFSKNNAIATLFLLILFVYFINSFYLEKTIGEDVVGPSSFPILVASFGFILLIIFFFQSFKTKENNEELNSSHIKGSLKKMVPILLTIIFVVLFELIGFLFSSIIYSFLFILYLKKDYKYAMIFSFIITISIFIIFYYGLNFRMPMGNIIDTDKIFPFLENIKKMLY